VQYFTFEKKYILKQEQDRYEMHKYWGKKPSNDLKALIEKYSLPGDTILDPFSGYGVFCCEAFLLNRNVISNDLNPIANFINNQLLEKNIDLNKLKREWKEVKKNFTPFVEKWFEITIDGKSSHLINILRNKENIPIKGRIRFTGEKKIHEIQFTDEQVNEYLNFEKNEKIENWYPDVNLIENSRISAKKGMKVSDLFTKRTLACHANLLSLIETISTGIEKDYLKLAFTANLANCSKLVPPIKTRGDMSQGAWMTGFYIGETYIENNVLHYFENRFKKLINGKEDYLNYFKADLYNTLEYNNYYVVKQNDAKNLNIPSDSIDYVFTDPPYGDAVPYFEQSIIWNSWLKFIPEYLDEIVISDSKERNKDILKFEEEIDLSFSEIRRVLKMGSYFSLTYHSLSGFEWRAITNACIKNGFELVDFSWLVQKSFTPRQINRLKSIKGDVLVTLQKAPCIESINMTDIELKKNFINEINNWLAIEPLDTNDIFLRMMNIIFTRKIIIGNINLIKILTDEFCFAENQKWTLNDKLELC
jgi:16S rRNA G966 N2-methylase RsmD